MHTSTRRVERAKQGNAVASLTDISLELGIGNAEVLYFQSYVV